MRILRLILEELVTTGRLRDGDRLTTKSEVYKAALNLIYSRGVIIGGMHGDAGISIRGGVKELTITLSHDTAGTVTVFADHQPFDEAQMSYQYVVTQLVDAVCRFENYSQRAQNTARMERLINDHLLILNEIEPFSKKEREEVSPEVAIVVSTAGMIHIEVHGSIYYAVSLSELKEYALDRSLSE